mmetsp:Transcript_79770/g.243913  ORF Transcript_79770/g.243913 Transcript_79770/m.243913 type:complete len:217 (-) Transcript_79770:34-684(-)
MSTPSVIFSMCLLAFSPPMIGTTRNFERQLNLRASSAICSPSSCVGAMIIAVGRTGPSANSDAPASRQAATTGIMKAAVLPEPVWADTTTSSPRKPAGIAYFCAGVGLRYLHIWTFLRSRAGKSNRSNNSSKLSTPASSPVPPRSETSTSSNLSKKAPSWMPRFANNRRSSMSHSLSLRSNLPISCSRNNLRCCWKNTRASSCFFSFFLSSACHSL